MSLLYAIHYYGLGSCALNWCVMNKENRKLRKAANIEYSHTVSMMIGVGHMPDKIKIPHSKRKPLEDIITYYKRLPELVK